MKLSRRVATGRSAVPVWSSFGCWLAVIVIAGSGLVPAPVSAGVVLNTTVSGQAWPWDPAINSPTYFYGSNPFDGLPPTVVSAADGFDFTAGQTLTIFSTGGLTNAFGGPPDVDANGYVNGVFFDNDPGSSGNGFPSQYMAFTSTHHIWLNELVGAFTDSSGVVIAGSPFEIGDGPVTVTIPVGATQLQMGVNDDIYSDNSGSLNVTVTQGISAVPEPASVVVFGILCAGLFLTRTVRRSRHRPSD